MGRARLPLSSMGAFGLVLGHLCLGCGAAPLRVAQPIDHPARWESVSFAQESAELRRRHERGDAFSGELEGTADLHVDEQSVDETKDVGPVGFHHLLRWQEAVVEAAPGGPFSIRSCYDAPELGVTSTDHGASGSEPRHCFEPRSVTSMNQWAKSPDEDAGVASKPPTKWSLDVSPPTDFIRAFTFPKQRLSPGTTWYEETAWTTHPADAPAVEHHRKLVWRFRGVEHAADGSYARLGCTADYDAHVGAETKGGSFRGEVRSKLVCAVRLSLQDGVTGTARVDFATVGRIDGSDGKKTGTIRLSGNGHVEGKAARSAPSSSPGP